MYHFIETLVSKKRRNFRDDKSWNFHGKGKAQVSLTYVKPNDQILKDQKSFCIKKDSEVVELDWNNLMVLTKCCAHNDWKLISLAVKEEFSQSCLINPSIDFKSWPRHTDFKEKKKKSFHGR